MSYDLGTAHGTIELEYKGGVSAEQAKHDVDEIGDEAKQAERKVDGLERSLNRLRVGMLALGSVSAKGGGILLLGAGLGQAAVQAANLGVQLLATVGELLPIASLAAGIPAALAGAAGTALVLKAAMVGVGDAFKAAFEGDQGKFDEALKKLAPSAREVAVAFQQAVKPIKDVQQALQQSAFAGLAPVLTSAFNALLPLRDGLGEIATRLNAVARTILEFAGAPQTFNFLSASLSLVRDILGNVNAALAPLLAGLRDAATVGLGAFDGLGSSIQRIATQFGNWLSQISGSGQLAAWINQGKDALAELGNIFGNLGSVLLTVIQTAGSAGAGFLGILSQATTSLKNFTDSAAGQQAIASIFTAIASAAASLAPVFTGLVGIIGTSLAPVLLNLSQTLGPALLAVVQGLAPAIAALAPGISTIGAALAQGLVALAPALAPLGAALGAVLTAIAPLLPMLGNLVAVVAVALAGGLQELAGFLGPVISLFSQLASGVLSQLLPALMQLVSSALPFIISGGQALFNAFAPLIPIILQLAQQFLGAMVPAFQQLQQAINAGLLSAITEIATALGGALLAALQAVAPQMPALAQAAASFAVALAQLFVAVSPLIPVVVQLVAGFLGLFIHTGGLAILIQGMTTSFNILAGVIGFITGAINFASTAFTTLQNVFTTVTNTVQSVVVAGFNAVVAFFQALPGRVLAFLEGLPAMLGNIFTQSLNAAAFAVGFGLGLIVNFFVGLPGRVSAAISSIISVVSNVFHNSMSAAQSIVSAGVGAVSNFFALLPGRIAAFLSGIPGTVSSIFHNAMSAASSAVSSGVGAVVGAFQRIPGAISGLAGSMFSAGADMIHGALSGILSAVGGLVDAARNAAASAVAGFKSALHIGSPSRLMAAEVGVPIVQGIIVGVENMQRELDKTISSLAVNSIVANIVPQIAGLSGFAAQNIGSLGTTAGGPVVQGGPTIVNNVEALPGMDTVQLAEYLMRRQLLALQSGVGNVALPTPSPAGA